MCLKDANGIANSVELDQTAQSDQVLHCLLRATCPNIWNFYCKLMRRYIFKYIKCKLIIDTYSFKK